MLVIVLAPDARLLVAAERRVRRIEVVAVGPHASRLDAAAEAIGSWSTPVPCRVHMPGAQAVERVVGDRQRVASSLKRVTARTGPKISSWKMRILLWPTNTVGWT
jgi:hypothetical protein